MKKYLLYINLLTLFAAVLGTLPSLAQKKYRYIKREHGVKFQGNVPITITTNTEVSATFQGAYAYNWKGFVEAGPYFKLSLEEQPFPNFGVEHWAVGLMGEYNFIKNRGKRKLIPSLGLQLGAMSKDSLLQATGGVHGTLKWFVDKRTAFITNLQFDLVTPFSSFFRQREYQVDLSMGFSYYFDFY